MEMQTPPGTPPRSPAGTPPRTGKRPRDDPEELKRRMLRLEDEKDEREWQRRMQAARRRAQAEKNAAERQARRDGRMQARDNPNLAIRLENGVYLPERRREPQDKDPDSQDWRNEERKVQQIREYIARQISVDSELIRLDNEYAPYERLANEFARHIPGSRIVLTWADKRQLNQQIRKIQRKIRF